jgi:4-amino-4-deoxy-L-arabinose transferase-like glycosyltransferase
MTTRWARVALLGSVLLAILSQWVLCCFEELGWLGVVGHAVALLLFVGSLLRWPLRWRRARRAGGPAWRLLIVGGAAGLVVLAAYLAELQPLPEGNYQFAILFWAAGVGLAVVGLLGPKSREQKVRGEWREAALVGSLFVVALALRLVGLAQFPDVMSGDEGSFALEAQRIMQGDLLNPFGTGWFANTTWFFYLQAAALRVLGWNLVGLRFTSAVLGAAGVVAVYLLARETFGREVAWVGAAFLAGWSLPLHFSRLGFSNGADPLLGALTLGFLQRGLVRGRRGDFVAAGLALGMGFYFYIGMRLMIPVVVAALFFSGPERLRRRWYGLLTFAVIVLLVAGPLLAYYVRHPETFMARHAVVGLFQSGQLTKEQRFTGRPVWQLFLEHLGPAVFVFIYQRDVGGYFYHAAIPMLYVLSGARFVLGVGLAIFRWREVRYKVLLVWLGLTVVFAGWLLKAPPHYDRYLIAAPAICLLVGRAAVVVLRRLARLWGWRRTVRRRLVVIVGVVLLVVNAVYYFGVYAPAGAFHWDRNTVIADRTARLMAELGPGYTTYFFGTPLMPLGGFNSVRFLAPDADWMDVFESPSADWSYVKEGRGALFVVIPQRMGDLQLLRDRFPDGQEQAVLGHDGQILFTVYRVEKAGLQ